MRVLGTVLVLIGIALPAPAAATYASEFIAVDRCLDGGGSYDYSRGACDQERSYPYIPFASRYPRLVRSFQPLLFVGSGLLVAGILLLRRAARTVV
jgi:hypothetical protein